MSDVKWIKLSTRMFDDEKIKIIEAMPEADSILIIWIKLLTLAGNKNMNGYIFLTENIPYTDEMFATIFGRPLNTVRLALSTFKKFGMIDYDEDNIIHITNWEKHQNIDGMERIKELNNKRARKYRERLSLVGGRNYLNHYKEIFDRDNGKCVYCGSTDNLCLDHLVPLIKGGDNEIDNLVTACKACNAGKSGRLIEEAGYKFINESTAKQYDKVKKRLNITYSITQHHALDKNKMRIDKNKKEEIYSDQFMETWKQFIEMRKKIKKPMTDRAKELILEKLDKLASRESEKIAILNQSIMNSWQGVFPLKDTGIIDDTVPKYITKKEPKLTIEQIKENQKKLKEIMGSFENKFSIPKINKEDLK